MRAQVNQSQNTIFQFLAMFKITGIWVNGLDSPRQAMLILLDKVRLG